MTHRLYYVLGVDGEAVSVEDAVVWSTWVNETMRDTPQRLVVANSVIGGTQILTTFTAIDRGFGLGAAPILWESLLVPPVGDIDVVQYRSRAAAVAGHAQLVAELVAAERRQQRGR